ncbi:MAG TPA: LamG-like jellyroll fold domain-containing protein, partial [Verrucomicrobiae bacterium]|nr:LamG-like jellyroll fold domain-containing protein [Verrucomicrobiae bacterium]
MKIRSSFAFSACLVAISWSCIAVRAGATVGATTPFTSVEAESGFLGGGATVVSLTSAPTSPYSSPQLEASGHAYVQLTATGQYVQWTNNTGKNITAINLRSCIPDAPSGGGIISTIDLYVNGSFRQAFSVNSQQNYCYEGTNYNGQTDKNPADGDPRGFWNDTHEFISGSAVAPGQTLGFQMDSSNTAAFYYIDVVDLEAPPPLSQPTNSVSILAYGAVSNNSSVDNTSAINNCFSACRVLGRMAWIPRGTFYISAINGGLNATGITIGGAGPWYSTIYRVTPANNQQGVANIINAISCTLADVSLDCNSSSRAGNNNNGAVDFSGANWLVTNVWIQHVTSSFWCAGVNGMAVNCRTLSTWADGGNFNNVQSADGIGMNLVYSNNFVRGTGDDAMAINSVHYNVNGSTTNYYTMMSNITYVNNTAIAPWGGKCMGLYGGENDLVANNLLCDTPRYLGLGVMRFGVNGSDLLSAVVTNNVLLRCGGNGYSQQQQGMMIGNGGDSQGVGTVENAYIASNSIIDALYDGVGFSTSTNIVFEYNTIINPGLDGVAIGPPDLGSGVAGSAILNYNTVTGLNSGRSGFVSSAGNFIAGGISNSGFTVPGPILTAWQGQDVGSAAVEGGASYSKGAFSIIGSGADIGGISDAFHYVYQESAGNCTISAQVAAEEIFHTSAKAGVMIRNSLDPADLEVSVLVTPENGILFESRNTYGGDTSTNGIMALGAPCWISLARNGNAFTASYSSNGVTWTTIGTPAPLAMATNVLAGLAITSDSNGFLSSAMLENVALFAPGPAFPAVHWQGDLIANLQSADLDEDSSVWVNRTSNSNSVGEFSTTGDKLQVATLTWNSNSVKALYVGQTLGNAVQSALEVPGEIISNNPVSAEAWIYATAVNQQNSCVVGYGIQGGPSSPEQDREFNYSDPCCGGGVSGDFGSYDTPWATTPEAGAWHYLAWSYDGSTVRLYLDGVLNASNNPSTPLQTPATVMGIGAGLSSGPGIAVDAFQGYIAAARVESGVLTAEDIATNFALGLLATAAAVTPSGLTATAGDGEVVLTWDSPGNATGYNVESSTSISGPYATIASNLNALSFTNTGLTDGTTYYFAVAAVNSAGVSSNSAPV